MPDAVPICGGVGQIFEPLTVRPPSPCSVGLWGLTRIPVSRRVVVRDGPGFSCDYLLPPQDPSDSPLRSSHVVLDDPLSSIGLRSESRARRPARSPEEIREGLVARFGDVLGDHAAIPASVVAHGYTAGSWPGQMGTSLFGYLLEDPHSQRQNVGEIRPHICLCGVIPTRSDRTPQ